MSRATRVRRALSAFVPTLALAAGLAVAGPFGAAETAGAAGAPATTVAVPPATKGATVDWFDDKYAALGPSSVFETATMERFEYLLRKPGKFAFIIGGPDSATLQASIGHINQVAQANGVQKIYNFNPKLDGGTLNVFDPSGLALSDAGKAYIGQYGTNLVNNYLAKDAGTPFSNAHTSDPYLFVYDGSGGDTARITGALTAPVAAADVDTPSEVTAYREDVAEVLASAGPLSVDTQFDFIGGEHNRRLNARNADDATYGGDIFGPSDAEAGFRIQSVTYPELIHILQSPGDFTLLFGGTWCHNTAAIAKATNHYAQEFGIKKVYAFDFVFNTNDQSASNGGSNLLHIRDSAVVSGENRRASYLYGDLVNTYLPNAFTQYRKNGDPGPGGTNFVSYYPGGDTSKPLAEARKIQVGHLLSYNKDHQDAKGNAAPVVNQAIRANASGGFTEYMTEWWFVLGQDLPRTDTSLAGNSPTATDANLNALQNNRAFAKEGIQRVRNVFSAVAGGYSSLVAVNGLPEFVGVGSTIPSTVTVQAPDYNGFYSNNGAGGSTEPSTGIAKPTGRVEVREGTTVLGAGTLTDGSVSVELAALPVGQHTLTFAYDGSADGVIAATTKTQQVTVTASTATVSVQAPASLEYGTAGTVTVTVTAGATGSVELTGLGGPKTAPIVNGHAIFEIPVGTPAGSYPLKASYGGDPSYGSATSDTFVLKVGKAASATSVSAPAAVYGQAGNVTVKVSTANGVAPGGSVKLSGAGGELVAPLSAGQAVFTLPKSLATGAYGLTATYAGDANVAGSSSTNAFRVDKTVIDGVKYKLKTKPTPSQKGKAKVTVAGQSGLAVAGGTVVITLKKGGTVKKVSQSLAAGKAVVTLPKLVKGSWKLKVSYQGDANYVGWRSKAYTVTILA